ncbi:MAG: hemerythrin domain-containing protein [Planctomycetes bacterium]|nr:hemerythrin domain-containing protein [Planctomycetota bacterium]
MAVFSIDDSLSKDHEQLDQLLQKIENTLSACSAEVISLLQEFKSRLSHHMKWEETVLFPAVKECCTQEQKRSIESLEIDHERIRETLNNLIMSVEENFREPAKEHLEQLKIFLQGHNYDEEHGVYAEADQQLDEKTRERCLNLFKTPNKTIE